MMGVDKYIMFLIATLGIAIIAGGVSGSSIEIIPNAKSQIKFVGETFYVSCQTSGNNVQRMMWTNPEDNQITTYIGRIRVEDGGLGHKKGVDLFVEKVNRKDQGKYTCSANIDGKEVEASIELVVYKKVDFADTSPTQFVEEGKDSTVICNADGDPKPQIGWSHNGKSFRFGAKYSQHPDHSSWLVVNNVTRKDAGTYTCKSLQLNAAMSNIDTFDIEVTVHHEPVPFPYHMNESFSYLSGVVNLTCAAEAEPRANFTWIKDGEEIEESDELRFYQDDHISVLQIDVVDDFAFGDYICKAENLLGTLERVVTLEKGEKPAMPRVKVLDTSDNSVTLSLQPQKMNPKMPVIAYRIEYKRPEQNWDQATVLDVQKGEKFELTNLKSDILYGIRVSAKNPAGFSDPSKEITQRTQKLTTSSASGLQFSTLSNILTSSVALLRIYFMGF